MKCFPLFLASLWVLALTGRSAANSIPVTNPSFEADNFPTFPGYRGGSNPAAITGWGGGSGINGTDLGSGVPFANNGVIPDGPRVAFIQGAGSLTQTLSGFTVGQNYWIQIWMNARVSPDQPRVTVSLAGQTLLSPQVLAPVGGSSPYYFTNFSWTATAPSAVLTLSSSAANGGDATALFDAVAVIQRAANEVVIANPSFEASGRNIPGVGQVENVAGWRKIFGPGRPVINAAGGPFLDNGVVPDGANVLVLQNALALEQSIAGLTPGQTYRLQLAYNGRNLGDDPRFRVRLGGITALDTVVVPVGVEQPYRILSFPFTATAEAMALVLENMGEGPDSSVFIDNVSIVPTGPAVPLAFAQASPPAPGGAGGLVTFNEIQYHPAAIGEPEWIEIVNQTSVRMDLSGWRIEGGTRFTFPNGTTLEPGAYLVISSAAGNPAGAIGLLEGALNNSGEQLRLVTRQGWLMDEVTYRDSGDWPVEADGTGVTLAKRSISYASAPSQSWTVSAQTGGTPGAGNFAMPPRFTPPPAHVAGAVVINEIHYHQHPTFADPWNGVAFAENDTEWLELYNRSATAVDLTGSRLDDAISYTFPPGTVIQPGGFLVVNQQQFSGSLANGGDSIKLRDPNGVLIDKVRYREAGRWAEAADGGGSSLELIDPDADNTLPESWAASDESAKVGWTTFSYRAQGSEPPGSNNPNNWREFLLGFLDAGTALIDDISVREDPAGANLELIQNGTFENDVIGQAPLKWRCLGTHKGSTVVQDPSGTGKVLRIVATGEHEHTYNTCSTTLIGNRVIDPLKTYEIRFRARWVSGSPQLNSRLYLNRAARTQILPQSAIAGTPGAPNSRRVANAGPTFQNLAHSPLVPAINQPVQVSVTSFDPDGLSGVTLWYSANGGAWQSTAMAATSSGAYLGTIPGLPLTGMIVQFYVEGTDSLGAKATFPARGRNARAVFRIGDGGVAGQQVANKLRLIMTQADADFMHAPVHGVSNARFGATLIANDREVFYDVGVRLRSAPFGRQGSRAGWNIAFDPEQPFRGVNRSIVVDGALNMPKGDGTGFIETSLGVSINELLYQRVAERAGGIAAEIEDIIYFAAPANGNRLAQLRLNRFSDEFLDDLVPNGSAGALFKQELVYFPTATIDGNPESLKNPYNSVKAVDTLTMGPSKDSYRFNYLVRNGRTRDDFSPILAMTSLFSGPTANLYTSGENVLDLDSWARTLALNALTGLADTFNQHLAHNIQFFARPSDGRIMLLPWDMDHAFYFAPTFSLYGGDAHRVKDLVADPRMKRRLAGHLWQFINTSFSNAYLDPWIDHYNAVSGQNYAANFKSWVSQRRAYVLSQLNSQWPATPFTITTNGGANFSVSTSSATLEGNAWIDTHAIRLAGATNPLSLTWLDGRRWRVTVPTGAGMNPVTLEAVNLDGMVVGSDSVTITNTGASAAAAAGNLAISELMYHPAPPTAAEQAAGFLDADDFEFLELLNVSQNTVDLTGAAFTAGIGFSFGSSALSPGQRLLLVRNSAAFAQRYGTTIAVHGVFTGKLDNAGEQIVLLDRGGVPIFDFRYDDGGDWPADADGAGFSLTLVRPGPNSDSTLASSWRTSRNPGGSPGASDALALGSFTDLFHYALIEAPAATLESGKAVFVWRERLGADEANVTPQLSEDLVTWSPALTAPEAVVERHSLSDGSREVSITLPPGANRFLRLQISN